jgi:glycosyltransferase involved in cell wall biosynthesis
MSGAAKPQVSVIVPCYNQARFLSEAVASLQNQTLEDWECIIINDGSLDHTQDIIRALEREDSRVIGISQQNRGLSAARNRGLRAARGTHLLFLDADDLIESAKLHHAVSILNTNPEIDAVATPFRYFRSDDKNTLFCDTKGGLSPWAETVWEESGAFLDKLLVFNFMSVNSVTIRASVARKIGEFNEKLRSLEDWEYWIRAACQGVRFHFEDAALTKCLIRVHSRSMSSDESAMIRGEIPMRRKILSLLPGEAARHVNFTRIVNAFELSGMKLNRLKTTLLRAECMGMAWVFRYYVNQCIRYITRNI